MAENEKIEPEKKERKKLTYGRKMPRRVNTCKKQTLPTYRGSKRSAVLLTMHRSGVQNFAWVGCASKIVLRQCRILRLLPVSATQQTVQRANVLKMRVRQKYYQYTPHHRNVLDSPRLCSPSYQLRSQNWRIQFGILTQFCLTTFFPIFVLGFALSQIPFLLNFTRWNWKHASLCFELHRGSITFWWAFPRSYS